MSSQYQLYQKTMEGFLASLDRLESQQADRLFASAPGEGGREKEISPATLRIPSLTDLTEQEAKILEEAVADIEQVMRKRRAAVV